LNTTIDPTVNQPRIAFALGESETLILRLMGSWRAIDHPPDAQGIEAQIKAAPHLRRIAYESSDLGMWDSGLLTFLQKVASRAANANIPVDQGGLPPGVQRLLKLAAAVPERKGARRSKKVVPVLAQIGTQAQNFLRQSGDMVAFIGETTLAFGRVVRARAKFRRSDLLLLMQECGAQALPIVSLISVLVGLILAFVGAVQLRQFGAQIFVADLVGIAMAREMGALMTAIIMAGRTGAAFAAQLGTMEVNEEIDALKTLGFSPIDFLVTPRMLALIAMMPILSLYADLLGIVGGGIVGVTMLDIPLVQYVNETRLALSVTDFAVGLVKSVVFGILIALSGCLRGLQCGRSASAVGAAATSAVVTAIVFIIVADGFFAVLTDRLGI
jgi:phospholipid/cholesterol/gamma-HCH transport system permease protein